jgi:uncharacterized protein YciI
MKYFLFKLNPPRPSFLADMTPAEGKLLQEHVAYWSDLITQGSVVACGPVTDPKGSYGIGIVRLEDGSDAGVLGASDPVLKAEIGSTFEVHPMPRLLLRE